jgi:hypothetical protein
MEAKRFVLILRDHSLPMRGTSGTSRNISMSLTGLLYTGGNQ